MLIQFLVKNWKMQAQVKASNFIGNVTLSKVEVDSLGIMNKMEFGVKK